MTIPRGRRRARAAAIRTLAAGLTLGVLAACGGHPHRSVAAAITPSPSFSEFPTPTSTPPVTASPAPVTPSAAPPPSSAPAPACSDPTTGWSAQRRAARLLVVPVLGFDLSAVSAAVQAGAGGVLFLGSTPAPANLGAELHAILAGAPVPLLVMADVEGGGINRLAPDVAPFPWPRTQAATLSPAGVRSLGDQVGLRMRAAGVSMDLAPVADIDAGAGPSASNPDGLRSYSGDPTTAASYALAFAAGLRSAGVIPVVKHFPGLGGSHPNTDYGPASTVALGSVHAAPLLPFTEAVAAGLPAVMVSNATIPGDSLPASLSSRAITRTLRGALGFRGLVVTDSLSAGAISATGNSLASATVAAIGAGADLVLFGSTLTGAQAAELSADRVALTMRTLTAALTDAVASGRLSQARLNEALGHVLGVQGVRICG